VLHENRHQLVALGEALDLLAADGAHQRGLTAVVRTEETVELELFKVQLGVTQEGQSTVREGEGTLVQVGGSGVRIDELLLIGFFGLFFLEILL